MDKLYRGDYLPFKFQLEYEDGTIKKEKVDEVIFWLKDNIHEKEPLIERKFTKESITYDESDNSYHFSFSPDDTKILKYDTKYAFGLKVFIDNNPYTVATGFLEFKWEGVFVYEKGEGDG